MTTSRDTLEAFFVAENQRDWRRYREFLHPDVEWHLRGETICGREAYLQRMIEAYDVLDITFRVSHIIKSAREDLIATLLIDEDGNRSLDIFEFEGGLIRREWEFLMGVGEGWRSYG